MLWKLNEEEAKNCCFVKPNGDVSTHKVCEGIIILTSVVKYFMHLFLIDSFRTVMYTCCRDGPYKKNISQRVSTCKRKRGQTRKLGNKYCLSRMTATENLKTGAVSLDYICTHTNHDLDISEAKYLPLPQSIKREVQEKFAKGISIERIMDGSYCFCYIVCGVLYFCIFMCRYKETN